MVKKEEYLEGGTKILQKKFIHIKITGKRCRTQPYCGFRDFFSKLRLKIHNEKFSEFALFIKADTSAIDFEFPQNFVISQNPQFVITIYVTIYLGISNCGFSEITKFCGNSKSIADVSALYNIPYKMI